MEFRKPPVSARRSARSSAVVLHRVEIGPWGGRQADELCGSLKAAGAQCAPRYE
jgi:hypothetical protein